VNSRTEKSSPRRVRPAAETREHILDVAEQLFYWQGIHATGVDTVAREAGVAPTTLYRLFASKDDLVAAYVDRYGARYREWIDALTADAALSSQDRILAVFDGLADNTGPDGFRGCPFLMALAEYPDADSAPHISAQAVKAWVRGKLVELAGQLPGVKPRARRSVADQLALVVEGLYGSTAALGVDGPAREARALAELILDSAAGRPR
jgi:AcrR family transcriptional regulator